MSIAGRFSTARPKGLPTLPLISCNGIGRAVNEFTCLPTSDENTLSLSGCGSNPQHYVESSLLHAIAREVIANLRLDFLCR